MFGGGRFYVQSGDGRGQSGDRGGLDRANHRAGPVHQSKISKIEPSYHCNYFNFSVPLVEGQTLY